MKNPAPTLSVLCVVFAGVIASLPVALAADPKPAKATDSGEHTAGINFAKSDAPLDVTADQGIEQSSDAKEVIAHVNAKAVRGNNTVIGDTLIAYYRPRAKPPGAPDPAPDAIKPASDDTSSSDVWRVVADGHVELFNPSDHVYGDHADYNVDDHVVVVTGDHLKMTTAADVITARDTLEYWEEKHQAVARGDAVEVRHDPKGDKRIQADMLVADFVDSSEKGPHGEKKSQIKVAHGYDHVVITTETDVVTGDRADYVAETNIVTVTGSVKITRATNQCNSSYAVVNLNTGISQAFSGPPGGKDGGKQVSCLIVPQKKAPAAAPVAPKVP